jgi:hypothetical protein
LHAESRLDDIKPAGGLAKMTFLGYRQKISEVTQFHRGSFSISKNDQSVKSIYSTQLNVAPILWSIRRSPNGSTTRRAPDHPTGAASFLILSFSAASKSQANVERIPLGNRKRKIEMIAFIEIVIIYGDLLKRESLCLLDHYYLWRKS